MDVNIATLVCRMVFVHISFIEVKSTSNGHNCKLLFMSLHSSLL